MSRTKTAMRSVDETKALIIKTLGNAPDGLNISDLARRMKADTAEVRPALTALVLLGQVVASTTRPTFYRLPRPHAADARQVNKISGVYDGAELRRNVSIATDRMAAFKLPSRVGSRLFYPDGRVEVVA